MTDRAALDALMADAADGDRAALEPLFAALWPLSVRYATKFLGDATLAEDCVQDALTRLFGQLARYDRERDALTWALTHVTWSARTARRSRERRREDAAPTHATGGAIDGASVAEERDLILAAVRALDALPARDIEIIVASLIDDDELRTALAPATFRKRLERALTRLRSSWRSRHGIP
jgi:RNA polymerase sigma-70 factor, ECF subfamily